MILECIEYITIDKGEAFISENDISEIEKSCTVYVETPEAEKAHALHMQLIEILNEYYQHNLKHFKGFLIRQAHFAVSGELANFDMDSGTFKATRIDYERLINIANQQ